MTITETQDGILLSWSYPRRGNIAIAYFTVDYCYDEKWSRLSKTELKPTETYFQGETVVLILWISLEFIYKFINDD